MIRTEETFWNAKGISASILSDAYFWLPVFFHFTRCSRLTKSFCWRWLPHRRLRDGGPQAGSPTVSVAEQRWQRSLAISYGMIFAGSSFCVRHRQFLKAAASRSRAGPRPPSTSIRSRPSVSRRSSKTRLVVRNRFLGAAPSHRRLVAIWALQMAYLVAWCSRSS